MTQPAPAAWSAEGAWLLEPSIIYALGAVAAITPELMSRRTPCRDWDLRMLLRHASESLAAIAEGIETGRVGLDPAAEDGDLAADPARAFRDRAGRLLDAWTSPGHQSQVIEIAGCPLAVSVMVGAAALEVAVHGWDISRACGQRQPIPHALATGLLAIAPLLVPRAGPPCSLHQSPCQQRPAPATSSRPSSDALPPIAHARPPLIAQALAADQTRDRVNCAHATRARTPAVGRS